MCRSNRLSPDVRRIRGHEARVNALDRLDYVKRIHIHAPERRSVMRERAVANGRARDRGEPAIEYRELQSEGGQYRQISLFEVIHDLLRLRDVLLLMEVTSDESLHVRDPTSAGRAAVDLHIHGGKVVVGIRIKLSLKLGQRLRVDRIVLCIRVGVAARIINSSDAR